MRHPSGLVPRAYHHRVSRYSDRWANMSCLLVSEHDLERVHNLSQRNGMVGLPRLQVFGGFDEDDKVIGLASVKNLGNGTASSSHDGGMIEADIAGGRALRMGRSGDQPQ